MGKCIDECPWRRLIHLYNMPWFVYDELGFFAFRVATGSAYINLATLKLQNGIRLGTVYRG